MCIKHEESGPVINSAPVAICRFYFVISHATAHSRFFNSKHTTKTATFIRTFWFFHCNTLLQFQKVNNFYCILEYVLPKVNSIVISRTPWHELCTETICSKFPGSSFTFKTSCRNCTSSIVFSGV